MGKILASACVSVYHSRRLRIPAPGPASSPPDSCRQSTPHWTPRLLNFSHLVAVPRQAHHFPRPQVPWTLFLVLFRAVYRSVARRGLGREIKIRGSRLLGGSPLCPQP